MKVTTVYMRISGDMAIVPGDFGQVVPGATGFKKQYRKAAAITTLSSREFNQNIGRAKQAASKGPVFIADSGQPTHVLMTIEDYQKLSGRSKSLAGALYLPGAENVELHRPQLDLIPRVVEFDRCTVLDSDCMCLTPTL